MWQEILEISHTFLIGDYQVNEGVAR